MSVSNNKYCKYFCRLEFFRANQSANNIIFLQMAFAVDDEKLHEVFKLAGRIVRAEVNKDREGKSRGFGIVDYSHPVEAVQAISMFNNQRVIFFS